MINTRINNLIETSADPVVILGIDHGFGNIKRGSPSKGNNHIGAACFKACGCFCYGIR